ncbi:Mobile element protein [Candidatus Enterovibrio altilux]|uniref:Mobile element protein n=1 Tax=Candidatus Enterovibrio altilux TaxID=1927128 RepID=A0A291B8A1_9GAMM|nr:Mobile element protein [Candidatus Enterovibrio luxaltus]
MVEYVFSIPLKDLQRFINPVFKFTQLPLSCPHYSCISKRTTMVNITFKKNKGNIQHLTIDSTVLKVHDEDE